MSNLFCVRAEFGTYTKHFVAGGYVALGWMPNTDLSAVKVRDELYPLYKVEHPDDTSNIVIGQQVEQIARFLLEMKAGDFVITPAADTELLHYGRVAPDPSYVYAAGDDGCPLPASATRGVGRGDLEAQRSLGAVPEHDPFIAHRVRGITADEFLAAGATGPAT